ncbi:hypothetical protein [Blastococcus sp. SYSU D00695]
MRVEERPLVRWVPAVDRTGRRYMEMRWELPTTGPQQVARAA